MNEYQHPYDAASEQAEDTQAEVAPQGGHAAALCQQIYSELRKVFFGQDQVVSQVLAALLAGGHVLLEGKPGLGKTHLVIALANTFGGQFGRIQFTPDLMPSDITGSEVLDVDPETGQKIFRFLQGPVFTNLLLADEINRTPPRTQSALLEAMQERSVTIGQSTHALPRPFVVFATMNPIEQEGTYILPEAELDRFLMQIRLGYPSARDEMAIASGRGRDPAEGLEPVATEDDFAMMRKAVAAVDVPSTFVEQAVAIVRATREGSENVRFGAGPRASQSLIRCAAARAALHGRPVVLNEDLQAVVKPVLRHRVHLTFDAISRQIDVDTVLDTLVASILD